MCDTTHPINQAYIIAQYKLSSQLQWHETQTPDLSKDHALLNYPLSKSCILSSSKQPNQATRPFQVHEQKLILRQTAYWVNCKRKQDLLLEWDIFLWWVLSTPFQEMFTVTLLCCLGCGRIMQEYAKAEIEIEEFIVLWGIWWERWRQPSIFAWKNLHVDSVSVQSKIYLRCLTTVPGSCSKGGKDLRKWWK